MNNQSIDIFEVYSPSITPAPPSKVLRVCSSEIGDPLCDPMNNIWERRKDLSTVLVRAVGETVPPFAIMDPDNNHEKTFGIFPELLKVPKLFFT